MDAVIHEDRPEHLGDLVRLNELWISEHFKLEAADRALAADPQSIWHAGGHTFAALIGEQVVGVSALFRHEDGAYELARMAVDPAFRGRGLGRRLALAALAKARDKGANEVMLLSNSRLEAALSLYRSLGFETESTAPHPIYARCNIVMRLRLGSERGQAPLHN